MTEHASRAVGGRSEASLATVYLKHSSLRRGNPMYRERRLPSAGRLRGGVSLNGGLRTTGIVKLRTEAPVNGGRNSNGPKVAKSLVG